MQFINPQGPSSLSRPLCFWCVHASRTAKHHWILSRDVEPAEVAQYRIWKFNGHRCQPHGGRWCQARQTTNRPRRVPFCREGLHAASVQVPSTTSRCRWSHAWGSIRPQVASSVRRTIAGSAPQFAARSWTVNASRLQLRRNDLFFLVLSRTQPPPRIVAYFSLVAEDGRPNNVLDTCSTHGKGDSLNGVHMVACGLAVARGHGRG